MASPVLSSSCSVLSYFSILSETSDGKIKAKCNKCHTTIMGSRKVTSNFVTHLKKPRCRSLYQDYLKNKADKSTHISSSSQLTLDLNLAQSARPAASKFQPSHPSQKLITEAIVNMVVTDMLPIRIVECEGFKNLVSTLEPRYVMTSRKHIQNTLLPSKFKCIQDKLVSILGSTSTCSITLDIWSSRRMHGYLGVTCHFITDNWELKSVLLSCSRLHGRHTGSNIVSEFQDIACAYGIYNKIVVVVTDNASNMRKGFSELEESFQGFELNDVSASDECESDTENDLEDSDAMEITNDENFELAVEEVLNSNDASMKRISCFAHTLQLCVSDGIKGCRQLKTLLIKVGKVVAYVRKSTNATEKLEEVFPKVLIAKNETRWNSQLMMVRRLLEVDDINSIVNKKDMHLSVTDKVVLQELVQIFEPFEEATKLVQGDTYASISLALPCFIGLQKHLENISVRHLQNLVSILKDSITTRLGSITSDPIYVISAVLDPEFKLSWALSSSEIHSAKAIITTAMNTCGSNTDVALISQPQGETQSENEPLPKRKKLFSFMDSSHISRDTRSVCQELDSYLSVVHISEEVKEGSLLFWKNNTTTYPLLSNLAKKYLAIPATSAPIERAFSTAGNILRQQRSRLLPKNFETLLFLKINSNTLKTC